MMTITDRLLKLGERAFLVHKDNILVDSRFLGGMSNYTYKVFVDGNPFVFRLIGDKGDVIVTPKIEYEHLKLIEHLNLTSKTIYFDVETGSKVSTFIDGEVLSKNLSNNDVRLVAEALKTLHQSNLEGFDYRLEERLNHYESLLKNKPTDAYYVLKDFWFNLYNKHFSKQPKVFCHGDAQRSNLIKYQNKVYLLDWEFSGMNDPYYDIASFGNIQFKDTLILLEAYLERKPTIEEINKVKYYRMYQVLQWHIVANYKDEVGLSEKLHMDFGEIAKKYLNFATNFYLELVGFYENN